MTRILFNLLLILSCSFVTNAQISKGSILLGGDLSYSQNKITVINNSDQKTNSGNFNISLGKAIRENSIFGINLNYQNYSNNYPNSAGGVSYTENSYGIGVFYRRYKGLGKDFFIFGEGGGGYFGSTSSTKDSNGVKSTIVKSNSGQIHISLGISYLISKKLFMELSVPQIFSASCGNAKTNTGNSNQFSIGLNLNNNLLNSLGLGFRIIL